jgi:hypothetical protein
MFTEMLVAYDEDGNVLATLGHLVQRRPDGSKRLVDFAALEERGGEFDAAQPGGVWHVEGAAGSKVWPERIDRPEDFRVEKEGPPGKRRIAALVHKKSGYRRERKDIEARLERRMAELTGGGEARMTLSQYLDSIKDIVGTPTEPIQVTRTGRTKRR